MMRLPALRQCFSRRQARSFGIFVYMMVACCGAANWDRGRKVYQRYLYVAMIYKMHLIRSGYHVAYAYAVYSIGFAVW